MAYIEYGRNSFGGRVALGEVSSGTMRCEDLIPKFIDTANEILNSSLECMCMTNRKVRDIKWINDMAALIALTKLVRDIEWRYLNFDPIDDDVMVEDMDQLFDALNDLAPMNHHFGSHEGDGACYGFWRNEPAI